MVLDLEAENARLRAEKERLRAEKERLRAEKEEQQWLVTAPIRQSPRRVARGRAEPPPRPG
jgi:hypothetical protein